ncbi:hypothetical protein ABDD95_00785 [Mucilaginibacter sp. PAMB04274]|uniref:hypothetical protein n=1 Tax=Mucilaginibacter sp. PAMB04274 TaxID=3138568 RepID=UPI0031F6BAD0
MHNRLKPLISLPFLICLALLIVNDFYLKEAFHNVFTGKLSDFCGLFIFPIFWSTLFPKHKFGVFILSGALFIYWKSEYAAGLIHFVSTYFFDVQRTVDVTDLIALPVLGLAWLSLKGDARAFETNGFIKQVSPYIIATLTVFSFCATSLPKYVQTFDQPQYILFQSDAVPDSSQIEEGFNFYHFDSLLVVQVNQLYVTSRPAKDDDYNKNLVTKNLEKEIFEIIPVKKSLMVAGKVTSLTIKTPQGDDHVNFNGGRLDGQFIRNKGGKAVIEGVYKMGIEDSIWTFRNTGNTKVTKITFKNGERTKVEQFEGGNLISSSKINTRAEVIRNKYIQIAALVLMTIGTLVLLVKNYRHRYQENLQIMLAWKWLVCLLLPMVVWLLQFAITFLLGDLHFDVFAILGTVFLIYVITCPLFFIVVFGIKLSRQIDALLYCLLFALAFSIWIEHDILTKLSV